jgi:hypothetical protein
MSPQNNQGGGGPSGQPWNLTKTGHGANEPQRQQEATDRAARDAAERARRAARPGSSYGSSR